MPQEQADLSVSGRVQHLGQPLFVRAAILDAQLTEPVVDGVSPAMRAVVGRGQVDVPPALLSDPSWRDPELSLGRGLHERQVLGIVGRVMHGLAPNHAAVSDEVREQPEPVLRPAQTRCQRLRDPARDRHPVAWPEIPKRCPPREREERVVRGRLGLPA
jgi:hypothetical protein